MDCRGLLRPPLQHQGETIMNEEGLPSHTRDLVTLLEQLFPDRIVTAELSAYEQGRQHGVIDLIRTLRMQLEASEEQEGK